MISLDGRLDLSIHALVLVLAAAVSALWLSSFASFLVTAASVAAFDWAFLPPRGTFHVDAHQHALLLAAMLAVSWIVSALITALRRQADALQRTKYKVEQLRQWSEMLRDATDPLAHVGMLHEALRALGRHQDGSRECRLVTRTSPDDRFACSARSTARGRLLPHRRRRST